VPRWGGFAAPVDFVVLGVTEIDLYSHADVVTHTDGL